MKSLMKNRFKVLISFILMVLTFFGIRFSTVKAVNTSENPSEHGNPLNWTEISVQAYDNIVGHWLRIKTAELFPVNEKFENRSLSWFNEDFGILARIITSSGGTFLIFGVDGTFAPCYYCAPLHSVLLSFDYYDRGNGVYDFYVSPGTFTLTDLSESDPPIAVFDSDSEFYLDDGPWFLSSGDVNLYSGIYILSEPEDNGDVDVSNDNVVTNDSHDINKIMSNNQKKKEMTVLFSVLSLCLGVVVVTAVVKKVKKIKENENN